jgi:hypothetical protein
MSAGPGALSLSYAWRTAFGPQNPEEARAARRDLEVSYRLLGD